MVAHCQKNGQTFPLQVTFIPDFTCSNFAFPFFRLPFFYFFLLNILEFLSLFFLILPPDWLRLPPPPPPRKSNISLLESSGTSHSGSTRIFYRHFGWTRWLPHFFPYSFQVSSPSKIHTKSARYHPPEAHLVSFRDESGPQPGSTEPGQLRGLRVRGSESVHGRRQIQHASSQQRLSHQERHLGYLRPRYVQFLVDFRVSDVDSFHADPDSA